MTRFNSQLNMSETHGLSAMLGAAVNSPRLANWPLTRIDAMPSVAMPQPGTPCCRHEQFRQEHSVSILSFSEAVLRSGKEGKGYQGLDRKENKIARPIGSSPDQRSFAYPPG